MNPISWVMLFLMFITIFILTNSINYFYNNKFTLSYSMKMENSKMSNWKW